MGLLEDLARVYAEPDPLPYAFQVGQRVRVLKRVVDDGQTHAEWAGAVGMVVRRWTTGLHKVHVYVVRHPKLRGSAEFKEEELDGRYARKVREVQA